MSWIWVEVDVALILLAWKISIDQFMLKVYFMWTNSNMYASSLSYVIFAAK